MTDPDDELLDRLRRIAAEVDPPPDLVLANARAALATRRLDDELAELVADSAVEGPVLVRGGADDIRLLSFETDTVSVELQLTPVEGRFSLRGLVIGTEGEVAVETAGAVRTLLPDDGGWFGLDDLPPGPLRVRVSGAGSPTVTTSWVSI